MAPSPPRDRRIKVGVRLRPFTKNERVRAGGKAAWTWHEKTIYQQIFPAQIPPRRLPAADHERRGGSTTSSSTSSALRDANAFPSSYALDHLFPPSAKTRAVYDETVKEGVLAAMEGYHSSVFVYGQTGTGKTYTMQGTRSDPGVIPLAVQDVFEHVARHAERAEFLLRFSYLEIYNERFYDLLAAGAKTDVKMLDVAPPRGSGGSGGSAVRDVALKGLREEIVLSAEHVLSLVDVGNLHRHMATTDANDQSSRSHVVFRLIIESQAKRVAGGPHALPHHAPQPPQPPIRSATLNLIDLAGSESVRLANTTGQHLDEGKFINRSLLTLGHIIWKLSRKSRASGSGHSKPAHAHHQPGSSSSSHSAASSAGSHRHAYGGNGHLPFRNSKLTRLLQPALSGHARIAIVCTAAPSVECLLETHGTLKFASRARRVLTRATINELPAASPGSSSAGGGDTSTSVLRKYRARLQDLHEQLETVQRRLQQAVSSPRSRRSGPPSSSAAANVAALEERRMELQFAVSNLQRSILNAVPPQHEEEEEEEEGGGREDAFQPSTLRPVAEDQEVVSPAPLSSASAAAVRSRPSLVTARSSGSESQNNSNKTLVGSGGSGSTKTLPLSTSSSRGLADLGEFADGETKGEEDEEDEPEHEAPPSSSAATTATATAAPEAPPPSSARATTAPETRPSLTTVLMDKYAAELGRLERREGRWSEGDALESERERQRELLCEFVRGLEIAQAEQETRMSKIRELEVENRRLRELVEAQGEARG